MGINNDILNKNEKKKKDENEELPVGEVVFNNGFAYICNIYQAIRKIDINFTTHLKAYVYRVNKSLTKTEAFIRLCDEIDKGAIYVFAFPSLMSIEDYDTLIDWIKQSIKDNPPYVYSRKLFKGVRLSSEEDIMKIVQLPQNRILYELNSFLREVMIKRYEHISGIDFIPKRTENKKPFRTEKELKEIQDSFKAEKQNSIRDSLSAAFYPTKSKGEKDAESYYYDSMSIRHRKETHRP